MSTKKSTKSPKVESDKPRTQIPAETLPRRTLEQVIQVADVLHNTYAGKSASWDDLAKALEIGPTSANTKYIFWSAEAYGIVNRDDKLISLSETGRKIVAPTYDQEDTEGKIKAVLTPTLLSKFYSDYNGHPIPLDVHFPNVLESNFGMPRDRVGEAISIIVDNAKFAGILEEQSGGQPLIKISGVRPTNIVRESAEEIVVREFVSEVSTVVVATDGLEWSNVCFYITPIGDEGSEVRKHADMMLKHLIEPVAKESGLQVVRADKIERSGLITQQIFEHLAKARLCVADLSFGNENAFYELGVRHVCKLPTIQIIRKGDKIPFDVSQGRTITVDTSDVYTVMDRFESARRELSEHVKHIQSPSGQDGAEDNPINVYLPGLKVTIPH